ncbi:hypothetical protein RRG08_026617 [Elysia crispata]|uniref:Uncharacterized protein n=1 Tax=Elysia crispata TaxID=231223 RepID=A0AAE1AZ82_9GAST|nr:hypothetical protein RRG08_026617 [Elysia crispata]
MTTPVTSNKQCEASAWSSGYTEVTSEPRPPTGYTPDLWRSEGERFSLSHRRQVERVRGLTKFAVQDLWCSEGERFSLSHRGQVERVRGLTKLAVQDLWCYESERFSLSHR